MPNTLRAESPLIEQVRWKRSTYSLYLTLVPRTPMVSPTPTPPFFITPHTQRYVDASHPATRTLSESLKREDQSLNVSFESCLPTTPSHPSHTSLLSICTVELEMKTKFLGMSKTYFITLIRAPSKSNWIFETLQNVACITINQEFAESNKHAGVLIVLNLSNEPGCFMNFWILQTFNNVAFPNLISKHACGISLACSPTGTLNPWILWPSLSRNADS